MMARMDAIHRLNNMGSKAEVAIAAAICPTAVDQNLHWVPNIAPSFKGWSFNCFRKDSNSP